MPIAISCQHCDWKGKVKDELAGKKGKCPTCGELVPIPDKPAPPPLGKRSAMDDEPDVVDDADVVEESPRPRGKPKSKSLDEALGAVGRRRRDDDDDDDRPRARRGDEDEDDRPRRRPADDDERPRSRRLAVDDDEDERPRNRRPRDDDEDDEDERPPRRRRAAGHDDEDDDRPRRRKRRSGVSRRDSGGGSSSGKKIGTIVSGVLCLLVGLGLLGLSIVLGKVNFWGIGLCVVGVLSIGQGMMMPGSDD